MHRFPAEVRLRSGRDYRRLSRGSARIRTNHFVLLVSDRQHPAPVRPGARLGLTASRKVGNAVVRNHVKRRVREWFRCQTLLRGFSIDLVVIAGAGSGSLDSRAVGNELARVVGLVQGHRVGLEG